MNEENKDTKPNHTATIGRTASTCSAFDKWWGDIGIHMDRNINDCMEVFMIEVAKSAWKRSREQAASDVCQFLLNLPPSECGDIAFHGIGILLQTDQI